MENNTIGMRYLGISSDNSIVRNNKSILIFHQLKYVLV